MNSEKEIASFALKRKNPTTPDEFYSLAAKSSSFYYHTRLDTAKKIISSDDIVFFVSPISSMNDENEKKLHFVDQHNTYILCFSHIQRESIPMWYLYSGITGEGSRIGFTPAKMKCILESAIEIYPVYNKKMIKTNPLHISKDYELEFGWVFYRSQSDKNVKYRESTYTLNELDSEFDADNFFVKDREWSYEKEFRIVFRLNNTLPNQIALVLDKTKMMRDDGLKITLSPQIKDTELNKIADSMKIPRNLVTPSKINAKMDLIARNQQSIVEHFSEVIADLNEEQLERMSGQIDTKLNWKKKELLHV